MSAALWPLQQAMYQRAVGDAALGALVSGVFDEVPENQAMPYVSLGTLTSAEADAHNQLGEDIAVIWHVWSAYRGNKQAAQVLAALDALFHRKTLTVAGFTQVSVARDQALTVTDPDPDIRHMTVRYRVWLTQEEE